MIKRLARSRGFRKFRRSKAALLSLSIISVYAFFAISISALNTVNDVSNGAVEGRPVLGMFLRSSTRREVGPGELPGFGLPLSRPMRLAYTETFITRAERTIEEIGRLSDDSERTPEDIRQEFALGQRILVGTDDEIRSRTEQARATLASLGDERLRDLKLQEAFSIMQRLREVASRFQELRTQADADEDELLFAQEDISITLDELIEAIQAAAPGESETAQQLEAPLADLEQASLDIFDAADPAEVDLSVADDAASVLEIGTGVREEIERSIDETFDLVESQINELYPKPEGLAGLVSKLELLLGTDKQGRSILIRAVYAGKIALQVGVVTAIVAVLFGTLLGVAAAFFGGWVDHAANWLYSMIISIPYLVLLAVLAFLFLGSRFEGTLIPLYTAFGLTYWTGPFRVTRGEALKIKELEYVQVATAIGFGRFYIMLKHIVPNTSHLMFINFSLLFIAAIKGEVILTFLGLGLKEGASWGVMISQSKAQVVSGFFWQLGAATFFMFVLVLAFNILTDALQDAFDPKHVS